MNRPAKAIFLSYASQDLDAARRIRDSLQAMGLEVWFDQSELRGGDAWDASIRKQIKECALFVPVISANTQSRSEGYFRLEWKLAVDRSHLMADDQAFLLPVVIDETVDGNARVPEKFLDVQWTHLSGPDTTAAFAERVQRLLLGDAVPAATPRTAPVASPAAAQPLSIAVLPFVNRSSNEEDEYFSDGLADELLNVLAKIRGLRVAARSSAFTFKGKGASVAQVGRALNVATVLEGSVRKAGNRMRISVQLVKVADGYHLWSESYDRTLDDTFAVQDDIAQSVVRELRSTLLGEAADANARHGVTQQLAAAARGRTRNTEAHRLYLQARFFVDRFTSQDTAKAIGYLKQSLVLDPRFALAWAELGAMYSMEADYGWVSATEGHARGREAVAQALALEPDLAEAHAVMAWIQMTSDWNWRAAEASIRRALELAPGNVHALSRAAALAKNQGRLVEAIKFCHRALEQDPLRASFHSSLASALNASGRHAESEAAHRKAIELAPQRSITHAVLSLNLLAQGRVEEASAEMIREPEEKFRLWAKAIVRHGAGDATESDAALEELIAKHQGEFAYQVAQVHGARGEVDHAFDWLERAYRQRDNGLMEMKVEPLLRSLHADPRWDAFLRKMGLAYGG